MTTTLYGIPNCDTIKKARDWLTGHDQPYTFHDYKKQGISESQLQAWVAQLGWEVLVNKQGTTWKKLGADQQAAIVDAASAIALMISQPSLIKRPVLARGGQLLVGFKPEIYAAFFA